ncbi:MAG: insulinase family protein [Candidatus Aminicenantes bacterium]|nr:insulinase family protein [Candidatus Aminicenantes bacterium]
MVKKTLLDSGLVVISEYRPEFPSFSLSYSLRSGSRAEDKKKNGIHHFIEHMMFKGSETYSAKKIADISDRLGGRLNAFTGKEITQYYIKVIDEKLKESFDLLTDIVMNARFPGDEFLKEKNVVLQEINESEDDPDTFAFERFYESVFLNNGVGFPITGNEDSVAGFDREMVYDFYKKNYVPGKLLLSAVGSIDHDELVELANRAFAAFPRKSPEDFSFSKPRFNFKSFIKRNSSLKQLYVIIGFEGIHTASPLKYRFMIMNDILGSGMSSRLFQKIREEKGLAYTVNSFVDTYLECGIHLVYAIIEPGKSAEYLTAVKEEIIMLKEGGITEEELNRAKDHIKSSVVLGLEGNVSKMRFNVNQEFFLKRELQVEEIIENIEKVTRDDINRLCEIFLNLQETSVFFYGNIPEREFLSKPGLNAFDFL